MHLRRRHAGLAVGAAPLALAVVALCACSGSQTSSTGTGGSPAGAGGATGAAGTIGSAGTTGGAGSVGTTGSAGATSAVHRQAVQVFVQRDGCSTQSTTMSPSWCDGLASQYQPCTCVQYQGCKSGYPVISCEYKAGHQFAPTSGTTLWNFFSQF